MFKNKKIKKLFSVVCTVLMTSYTGLFGCDTVLLALKYNSETGTVTLDKPLHQIIITSKEHYTNETYTEKLKEDFKFTDYWNFEYENDMTQNNVIQHVVPIDKLPEASLQTLQNYDGTEDVIYSIDLNAQMDYNIQSYYLSPTALIRNTPLHPAAGPKKRLNQLMEVTPPYHALDGQSVVCQLRTASSKQKTLYIKDSTSLLAKPKLPPHLPAAYTIKTTCNIMQKIIDRTTPAPSQTPSERTENNTIFSKTKKFVHKNPTTRVGLGAAVLTLGGTIIYKIKKLFTRQSKRSQTKSQINQKYNQYVKNKI